MNGLLAGNTTWIDRDGNEAPLTLEDILNIAPYNAQVFAIQQVLPGARVGTVDKSGSAHRGLLYDQFKPC